LSKLEQFFFKTVESANEKNLSLQPSKKIKIKNLKFIEL